jgi:hypothetical protein
MASLNNVYISSAWLFESRKAAYMAEEELLIYQSRVQPAGSL